MEELLMVARDGGGWAVLTVVVGLFLRALTRGDIRLGREVVKLEATIDKLSDDYAAATARIEAATQRETAAKDDQLRDLQQRVRDLGGRLDAALGRVPSRTEG